MSENHDLLADLEEMKIAAAMCRENEKSYLAAGIDYRAQIWAHKASEYEKEAEALEKLINKGQ